MEPNIIFGESLLLIGDIVFEIIISLERPSELELRLDVRDPVAEGGGADLA